MSGGDYQEQQSRSEVHSRTVISFTWMMLPLSMISRSPHSNDVDSESLLG
jgi:hypothetical protein